MSLGRHKYEEQGELWTATDKLVHGPSSPFYGKLNELLREEQFDSYVESICAEYYAEDMGRPGIPPGVYFRMLMVGYFERIVSERGIAWRCADSLSLRRFLGFGLDEETPEHSSLCRIRQRFSLELHEEVFGWVLSVLARRGLIDGKTLGVDSTTLEANAALRSLVRRDTGEGYEDYLRRLLKEEQGIEDPTRSEIAKFDRKRKKKGSNDEWENPHDPDAQITKMKSGGTDMGHKVDQAVDLGGHGAVLGMTLHGGARGDTQCLPETLQAAQQQLDALGCDPEAAKKMHAKPGSEVVADKGYHSNETAKRLEDEGRRTYISEPERRGKRNWEDKHREQKAVYANRRRIRGERGKRLLRKRGELLERPFEHYLDAGGMRRTYLRGHRKIMKRLLVHVAGFNLGLLMRTIVGYGTPRQYAEAASAAISALLGLLARLWTAEFRFGRIPAPTRPFSPEVSAPRLAAYRRPPRATCSTAC
jgi:transposase